MKTSSLKPILICILLLALFITVAAIIVPSTAYFSALFDMTGTNSVMVELIFDRLTVANGTNLPIMDITNATPDTPYRFDSSAEWGSAQNPYVISQKMHIQNLSVLQNSGFFNKRVDENGNIEQSYFLVCKPDGTTVSIDCDGLRIDPVGTAQNPFTGVICGSFNGGTGVYKEKGVSVSTIANLKVNAKEDSPDIGFFGHLGYYGTYDKNTATIAAGGYAARIDDLLFADVTITSDKSWKQTIEEWWSDFSDHTNFSKTRSETHHIGIVAGHAEFATLTNISVYYNDGVSAFELDSDDSGSVTNYYSSTGIIGLLQYVNPTVGENGALDGTGGISDSDISSDGGGGGGEESGTLTGYMLAENLFSRHEEYLTAQGLGKSDVYNVREMKKKDGNALFESVVMKEKGTGNSNVKWTRYYFFRDTVFTFAMSMSTPTNNENGDVDDTSGEDPNLVDYVMKIWELDSEGAASPIHATSSADKLKYSDDLGASSRVVYKMTAVEGVAGSDLTLENKGYYVLAYHDIGSDAASREDDKIYLLNINAAETDNFAHLLDVSTIYTDDTHTTQYYSDGSIKEISLIGTDKRSYDYSFLYTSAKSINSPDPTVDKALAIHTKKPGFLQSFQAPSIGVFGQDTAGGWFDEDTYITDWKFTYGENGKFAVYNTYTASSGIFRITGWTRLEFNDGAMSFPLSDENGNRYSTSWTDVRGDCTTEGYRYFTLLKLTPNEVETNGKITNIKENGLGNGNLELTPKNIIPVSKTDENGNVILDENGNEILDTMYSFDPSRYVLEYKDDGTYKLAPIRSYRLNNGQSNLLEQLNHIVKLYKPTDGNYRMTLGSSLKDIFNSNSEWWDNLDSNSGGVVLTNIGTTDTVYSIPAGMIAFDLLKASPEEPSYINIIVAVNPEQKMKGRVGLWKSNENFFSGSFDLNGYVQSFELPISKTAVSDDSDRDKIITVSEYVTETVGEDGKRTYQTLNENSYIYLGGDTVFVYYKFTVTEAGIYLIGSPVGSLSVSYFSVSGAAGAGNDGASGSPLGDVDFVYSNDTTNQIITVDNKFTGDQIISEEDYTKYYPSLFFLSMLPENGQKIQLETIKVRRYIDINDSSGTKRHIKADITGQKLAALTPVSELYEDIQDDLDSDSP